MTDTFDFTIEELIKDIWGKDADADGFFTTRELSRRWGVSQDRVREILRRAGDAGYTIDSARVRRRTIDGRFATVPAYRITREGH